MLSCGLLEAFVALLAGFHGLFTALCHLLLLLGQACNPCSSTSQLSSQVSGFLAVQAASAQLLTACCWPPVHLWCAVFRHLSP